MGIRFVVVRAAHGEANERDEQRAEGTNKRLLTKRERVNAERTTAAPFL